MVFHISYTSHASRPMSRACLAVLRRESAELNAQNDMTGLLFYAEGNPGQRSVFLQHIEGPKEAVQATFERIQRDGRHRDVEVLSEGFSKYRLFPDWSMELQLRDREELLRGRKTIVQEAERQAA